MILFWLSICIMVFSCNKVFFRDYNSPCYNERDTVECNEWKRQFPREYNNYLKRMKK